MVNINGINKGLFMSRKNLNYKRLIGITVNARVAALHNMLQQLIANSGEDIDLSLADVYEVGLTRTLKKICETKNIKFEETIKPLLDLEEVNLELTHELPKSKGKRGRKQWPPLPFD